MKSISLAMLVAVSLSSMVSGEGLLKMPFGSTDEQFFSVIERRKVENTLGEILRLSLHKTQITDDGLVPLRDLSQLKSLSLSDTQISDVGLAHLEGLTQLEILDLFATRISNQALPMVGRLSCLQILSLRRTGIRDAGLVHLAGLSRLKRLDLRETQITDAARTHLKVLGSLQSLDLRGSKFTSEGFQALKKALPDTSILFDHESPRSRPLARSPRPGGSKKPRGLILPDPSKPGTLRVKVALPEGIQPDQVTFQIYDFRRNLLTVAKMLLSGESSDRSPDLANLRVPLIKQTRQGDIHILTVLYGIYHVRISLPSGRSFWIPDQRTQIGLGIENRAEVIAPVAKFGAPGELLASWTLDQGKLQKDGTYAPVKGATAQMYLVRGGLIYAKATVPLGQPYRWKAIPIGSYSLVVKSDWKVDDAIWAEENVVVSSGQQTEVKVQMRRARLGQGLLCLRDRETGEFIDSAKENVILLDGLLRFAVRFEEKSTGFERTLDLKSRVYKNKTYYGLLSSSVMIPAGLTALFRIPGYEPYEKPLIRVMRPHVRIISDPSPAEQTVKIRYMLNRIFLTPKKD
ncbi:MAG: hypothetical protein QF752_08360 [Planctomycetota bacterium]|nr:hypothetical protein [Planctomycetota bacterium]